MDLYTHNEINEILFKVHVKEDYPKILDKAIEKRKGTYAFYCTIWINAKIQGVSPCIRTKLCIAPAEMQDELRNKYQTLQRISYNSRKEITIIKISVSSVGISND